MDYGHPLIAPVGTYVVTHLVNRIEPLGRFAGPDDATTLSDIDNIYPLEMVPWWLFSNYFYRQARRFGRFIVLPAIVILFALRILNDVIIRFSEGRLPEFSAGRIGQAFVFLVLDVAVVLSSSCSCCGAISCAGGGAPASTSRYRSSWRARSTIVPRAARSSMDRGSRRIGSAGSRRAGRCLLYGHNHIAELGEHGVGARQTAFVNTGTWMREVVRLPARLKLPPSSCRPIN